MPEPSPNLCCAEEANDRLRLPMPSRQKFGPCSLRERMKRDTLICSYDMKYGMDGICDLFRKDILGYMQMFLWRDEPLMPFLDGKKEFPRQSVIYFVNDERGQLQYIGKASNLRSRWHKHQLVEQVGDAIRSWGIEWWPVHKTDASMVELVLIQALKPALNKRLT